MDKHLHIKNMVCDRCIMVVRDVLAGLQLDPLEVKLGEVILKEDPNPSQLNLLRKKLQSIGFELIDSKKSIIIQQIKNEVIRLIHERNGDKLKFKNSVHLANHIGKDYAYLSNLFSEVEGTTIEQYIIRQKIERAKELLVYDEMTIAEIADHLGYSSTAHLSSQFKKVTGLSPSHFKEVGIQKRKPLDKV